MVSKRTSHANMVSSHHGSINQASVYREGYRVDMSSFVALFWMCLEVLRSDCGLGEGGAFSGLCDIGQ